MFNLVQILLPCVLFGINICYMNLFLRRSWMNCLESFAVFSPIYGFITRLKGGRNMQLGNQTEEALVRVIQEEMAFLRGRMHEYMERLMNEVEEKVKLRSNVNRLEERIDQLEDENRLLRLRMTRTSKMEEGKENQRLISLLCREHEDLTNARTISSLYVESLQRKVEQEKLQREELVNQVQLEKMSLQRKFEEQIDLLKKEKEELKDELRRRHQEEDQMKKWLEEKVEEANKLKAINKDTEQANEQLRQENGILLAEIESLRMVAAEIQTCLSQQQSKEGEREELRREVLQERDTNDYLRDLSKKRKCKIVEGHRDMDAISRNCQEEDKQRFSQEEQRDFKESQREGEDGEKSALEILKKETSPKGGVFTVMEREMDHIIALNRKAEKICTIRKVLGAIGRKARRKLKKFKDTFLKCPVPAARPPVMLPQEMGTGITLMECVDKFPASSELRNTEHRIAKELRAQRIPVVSLKDVPFTNANMIGTGAFGTCYRYHFADVEKPLVVKIFKETGVSGLIELMVETKGLLAVKGIAGVPMIYAVCPIPPYAIVMSDAGTITFDQWVSKMVGYPMKIISMLEKIARIATDIHGRRIMHRDLSGKNIVVNEETNHPTIVDFGIASSFGRFDVNGRRDVRHLGDVFYSVAEKLASFSTARRFLRSMHRMCSYKELSAQDVAGYLQLFLRT